MHTRTRLTIALSLASALAALAPALTRAADGNVPRIVSTSPANGDTDVNPALAEITVTFDRDMGPGFSWTGGGPEFPAGRSGKRAFWRDRRTCVMPVQLEPGHAYRVGINAPSYRNFQSTEGVPAIPTAIRFTTKGTPGTKPRIVKLVPLNGAKDVDPALTEIRVTFNIEMGGGCSWTGSGPNFPTIPEGKKPYWTEDKKTCVLPVQLQPNWEYHLGFNSPSYKNFRSAAGVPLDPIRYGFKTR